MRVYRHLTPEDLARFENFRPVAETLFNGGLAVSLLCLFDPEVGQRSDRDDSGWCEE